MTGFLDDRDRYVRGDEPEFVSQSCALRSLRTDRQHWEIGKCVASCWVFYRRDAANAAALQRNTLSRAKHSQFTPFVTYLPAKIATTPAKMINAIATQEENDRMSPQTAIPKMLEKIIPV